VSSRVLFVDPDRSLLGDIEPALRASGGEWAAVYVRTRAEAFDQLETSRFDAVVAAADVTGAPRRTFLDEVADRHPMAARFLLARHGGRDLLLAADGAAHQHLSRPFESADLFARLNQTILLHRLLTDPGLKAVVARLKAVPSPAPIYLALMSELRKDHASARKAGELVAQDAGMAAKILQLVNSPFFGLRMPVCDPAHAVRLLGLDTLRALVLSAKVFEQLDPRVAHRFHLHRVWRHSMASAGFAKLVAYLQDASAESTGEAFSAALLHDIGKLVLAASLPEDYKVVIEQAEAEGVPLWMAERDLLQTTHAEVGAYLLGLWGVPGPIVDAVANHHVPSRDAGAGYFPLSAVHVANVIDHQAHPADVTGAAASVDAEYVERFQIGGQIPVWTSSCLALNEA
jgi:HD-like signal output (HDOD) protein